MSPWTKKRILEIISSLCKTKATGINSTSIKTLKLTSELTAEQLRFINNLSFATGIFSDSLKIIKVTPFYKKGPKLECSLPSNFGKMIEKLIHKRLMGFLKDQKILYKNNLDFKKASLRRMQ